MKPLKLTLNAFGPYAGRTVLDFNDLLDNNIYLVCGPTGAGKTTIFDGIAYALYDEPSGSGRETKSFRSDFAKEDEITSVELEFRVRDKEYRISRKPEHIYLKKYANGKTKYVTQKSEVELSLKGDDKAITNKAEVQKKIKEIVGLDEKQFRQIVMLPQGEFKKLLEAESKDKETIFRNVFGTEKFSQVKDELVSRESTLRNKIFSDKNKRDTFISRIDCGDMNEELSNLICAEDKDFLEIKRLTEELISEDEIRYKKVCIEKSELDKERSKAEKDIHINTENNKRLERYKEVLKRLEELNSEKEEISAMKIKVENAKKAGRIVLFEKAVSETEKRISRNKNDIEKSRKQLTVENKNKDMAQDEFIKAQKSYENSAVLIEERKKLSDEREKLEKYNNAKKTAQGMKAEAEILGKKLKDLEDVNKKTLRMIEDNEIKSKSYVNSEVEKIQSQNEFKEKEEQRNAVADFYKKITEYIGIVQEKKKCDAEFSGIEAEYKELKNKYEKAEELFRKSMAGILADGLAEESPCPVCGSTNHPHLAVKPLEAPSEEELDDLKKKYEEETVIYNKFLNELAVKENHRKNFYENIICAAYDRLQENGLVEENIREDIEDLKKYITSIGMFIKDEKDKIAKKIELIDKDITEKARLENELILLKKKDEKEKSDIQEGREDFNKKNDLLNQEIGLLKEMQNSLSEDNKDDKQLENEISAIENKIRYIEKQYKEADGKLKVVENIIAGLNKEIESKNNELNDNNDDLKNKKESFANELKKSGFESDDDYRNSILSEEIIESIEKRINSYSSELSGRTSEKESLEKDITTKETADIEGLNKRLADIRTKLNDCENEEKVIFTRLKNNRDTLSDAVKADDKIKNDEGKYKAVGELARLAKGDNSQKITFERYVLAAYFEDIVKAANIRLEKMSNGRFSLKRKNDISDKRRQAGLELDVFDAYTGKERHVKTLSGGEGFKASLALALGLADVIQSHAGGVLIETMFIDEGFGTLDNESLDSAIDTLMDLRSLGRIVGIISHVDELKERLNARLEVTASKNGSTAQFIVR